MQSLIRALKTRWEYWTLFLIALVPRLYLLRVYDVELSNDGFDSVNTLAAWQVGNIPGIPHEWIARWVLHPLHMFTLCALRLATPAAQDFYLAARLLSTVFACLAVVVLFVFVRDTFDEPSAWAAALLLAFAPTFLYESATILSSTLFLLLYVAVVLALSKSRYRVAALFAFLAAITRLEGVMLVALVFAALAVRDARKSKLRWMDWIVLLSLTIALPLTIFAGGWAITGNPLEFLAAQSVASFWLRFLAPADFLARASFFLTRYSAFTPLPVVWLGVAGGVLVLWEQWKSKRLESRAAIAMLFCLSTFYLLFFETLVWLNYIVLDVRYLMYPGLPLLVFAGVALADLRRWIAPLSTTWANTALAAIVAVLCVASYQQGDLGMQFIYNSQASMRQMAEELAQIFPTHQRVNVLAYGGTAGALDFFARQHSLQLAFTEFRFAPDDNPEQYVIDRQIRFVIYPVGNAFAKAKYPYLARFEEQTQGGVTFHPLVQFATSLDNQLYSIWSADY